tara:strand:- start:430 stop:1080 length:651 start_codon:yes stop_codon:yes gene_type:complete
MSYFRHLPDIEYPTPFKDRVSDRDYIKLKNFFRRVKLRDDVQAQLTVFDKYEVRQGERPDTIANDYYGDPQLDWLVLISNNIVNVRDEWPLDDKHLYEYALEKYGNDLNNVKYYVTKEVKDNDGRLRLPAGIVVQSNFQFPNPNQLGNMLNPVTGVTNYEYEALENDKKRSINLLRTQYVQQAINDLREDLRYDRSSQFVNNTTIRADNNRVNSAE